MRQLLSILTLLILLFNPVYGSTDKPLILVLGDSISSAWGLNTDEGWVSLLQERINEKKLNTQVINTSVSGDTTRTALNRLDDALMQHNPTIIIIALGGNDGLRGLPFSEIEKSLSTIIEKSRQASATVLLAGIRMPPNYGVFYNSRLAALFQGLSVKYKVPLVPKILDKVADDTKLMQDDRMHPTAEGQKQVLDNVWVHLQPLLTK